jgi:hypothetical protein
MPFDRMRAMLTLRFSGVSLSTMAEWQRHDPPHPKLTALGASIYLLLAKHAAGLDITQIRDMLGASGGDQEHLNRRVRDLRKYYVVERVFEGGRHVYILKGLKDRPNADDGAISGRLRSEVLHMAKGRCQMCGRTVAEDHVKLQADHKIPQSWGGATTAENLWAICESCNNGKRDYFSSFDDAAMGAIMAYPSVHERIAHLLKMNLGKPVSSRLLEFVANATERQEDWHKRLRDLRYPPIGLEISVGKRRTPEGYIESTYTLHNWRDIPPDHKRLIREHEKLTNKKRKPETG